MTPEEMKFIADKSATGAVGLMLSALKDDNPIWRHMMELGWARHLRQTYEPSHLWSNVERDFLSGLNLAKVPESGAEALKSFFESCSAAQVTQALTKAGDAMSPIMRWTSAPARSVHVGEHRMVAVTHRLLEQAVELGCDINAASPVTIDVAKLGKQRAEHTALSHLMAKGSLIVGNPGADGPGSTGQKADLLAHATALVRNGAKFGQREAAALTQMVSAQAAVNWIAHMQSLGACTAQEVLSLSGRLKRDPEALAAIQAISAKAVMSSIAKLRHPSAAA